MSIEPTDTTEDNLDDFSATFFEQQPKEEVKEDQEVEPEVDDTPADDEPKDEPKDEPQDDPDGDDEEERPKDEPKKVNRFQERINELTAKAREAERAKAELERKIAEIEAKKSDGPKQAEKSQGTGAPTPDDKNDDGSDRYPLGEFDPQYIRDLTRHTIQEETARANEERTKTEQQREIEAARNELHNNWVDKLTPMLETHEDFLDKTLELEATFEGLDPQYSDYLAQTIKSLDHGPEVLYYFANNLDEAKEFVRKGPLHATITLGEMNAMFKGQKRTNNETKVSSAPPPPQVNLKGSNVRKTVRADTDDLDAFENAFFKKK